MLHKYSPASTDEKVIIRFVFYPLNDLWFPGSLTFLRRYLLFLNQVFIGGKRLYR